jgi:glycosyltransferase involved in cell wall biosynthesis
MVDERDVHVKEAGGPARPARDVRATALRRRSNILYPNGIRAPGRSSPAARILSLRHMRILCFNPSYPPVACGVGAYTRGLAHALEEAGHDVTVVTSTSSTTYTNGRPRVLALLAEWDIRAFLRAWPYFWRPRPDLVVSSFPAVVPGRHSRLLYLLPGLAKLTLRNPRTVFILHEFIRTGDAERSRMRLGLRAADRIVAVTDAERDALVARYPSTAARTVVRNNPATIPVAAIDPSADAKVRAQFAPPERPVVAFGGLLTAPAKGFDDLLEALTRTDALLVATGSLDPENVYHAHVGAQIERLGLGGRVRWLGFISDNEIARVLRAVDVVVLPHRSGAESGHTSMLAALVNGAAVVTTRGANTPPWLRDGETALLVAPENPDELATAIARLAGDVQLSAKLRAAAGELSFGWADLVEAVVSRGPVPAEAALASREPGRAAPIS